MLPSQIARRVVVSLHYLCLIIVLTAYFTDFLQVAIDITSNGEVRLPQYYLPHDLSEIHNITIFLTSYVTGKNFTITNGTASRNNASLGDILFQESTSSVKYVNWTWPDCLVGSDGVGNSSTRGPYNVSDLSTFATTLFFGLL